MIDILNSNLQEQILEVTLANSVSGCEVIQGLWSGYGKILRLTLEGGKIPQVVVKQIQAALAGKGHPRGWDSDASHQRKVTSYEVEATWYREWGTRCDEHCRVPELYRYLEQDEEVLLVLEDLDTAGFSVRKTEVTWQEVEQCLRWLAEFHASFMKEKPMGLWEVGTYWHLDTRQDEWKAMKDGALKKGAGMIDQRLREAEFQTIVHGDAKLANFCFSETKEEVAAVDFQYVGGGCGMKDVAYFMSSCLDEETCMEREGEVLNFYFSALREALFRKQNPIDGDALEKEWRDLFPLAWTDFYRFLEGWSPGHWKVNEYSKGHASQVLAGLLKK